MEMNEVNVAENQGQPRVLLHWKFHVPNFLMGGFLQNFCSISTHTYVYQ